MTWCERNRVGYIFGLAGNPVLLRQVGPLAGTIRNFVRDWAAEPIRPWLM